VRRYAAKFASTRPPARSSQLMHRITQVPIGLVLPRDAADVEAAVAACRELGAPVLSRGGGTSPAGQCCNVAVVLDN
jgi:FAD/FMN-containing dehydrogenase